MARRRFDCAIVENELWVARDSEHHYITKFTLRYGEWKVGNKRGVIGIKDYSTGVSYSYPSPRVTMTVGYYENQNIKFNLKLRESNYNILMEYAMSQ
jgi:hypothetical protein